jgi:putative transposase
MNFGQRAGAGCGRRNKFREREKMKEFYWKSLPHWIPPEATFFVTFRLANSLPAAILTELMKEREKERNLVLKRFTGEKQQSELYEMQKKWFARFDAWLDRCLTESPRWLAHPEVACIIAREIHAFDGEYYKLLAYTIMPNHIHLLVNSLPLAVSPQHRGTTAPYPLADTLKRLKGRTARYANQALGRSGAFWQHESYDHVVRDAAELERILCYILANPVNAGLVSHWGEWPHTFVIDEFGLFS